MTLQKRTPQIWGEFRASGTKADEWIPVLRSLEIFLLKLVDPISFLPDLTEDVCPPTVINPLGGQAELRARRQAALEQLELREAERLKKRQAP